MPHPVLSPTSNAVQSAGEKLVRNADSQAPTETREVALLGLHVHTGMETETGETVITTAP